jgi:hypothetical protein
MKPLPTLRQHLSEGKAPAEVTFFNVMFAGSHAEKRGMISQKQLEKLLDDVKGNRVKVSELTTLLDASGAKDPTGVLGMVLQAEQTGDLS